MNIKCLFGLHDWSYWEKLEEPFKRRFCRKCGKKEIGEYDMSYGETNWRKDDSP